MEVQGHEEKERKVNITFGELCDKHEDSYTKPQLKLWARMIINDLHESYDQPPNVPMITGTPKPHIKETLTAGAAAAFVTAVSPDPTPNTTTINTEYITWEICRYQDVATS